MSILDIATGPGEFLEVCLSFKNIVLGIDNQDKMLERSIDGLYNQSIQLMMQENAKLLSFEIQDETFPPLSVKALTISNSSVNINTKNDSIVIIVGSHRTSGSGHDSDTHMCHYRIGGPEDTANTIAPGFMTVSTSNTCHVVCVEKI